ncbi:MAG: hypothetical protein ACYTGZ_09315 [Planctomycetota bacterium]|jgi:hypothetical protein
MRSFALLLCLLVAACGGEDPKVDAPSGDTPASKPKDRDVWWKASTERPGGAKLVLAPREVRVLLADGRRLGYNRDAAWWSPKKKWAYEQILGLDPEDVEANAAVGRKTLQAVPGFEQLWIRMLEAKVYNTAIEELLEQYQPWVDEERPIFLTESEREIAIAKLRSARKHLDRMDSDPEYAALRHALERVPSQLKDYPAVHVRTGPFLVFFAAPDLRRIKGESEEAEDQRLEELRARYEKQLKERVAVLDALLKDIEKSYPKLAKRHTLAPTTFFFMWIFSDPVWYTEFAESIARQRLQNRYRCGFFNPKDMWGYLFLPRAPEGAPAAGEERPELPDGIPGAHLEIDPETQLKESLAYIATQQLLRHWGRDPKDDFSNRLDRSRAYWLKEGWPTFMAARRVAKPSVGTAVAEGWRFGRVFPPIQRIVERESRLALFRYQEPPPDEEAGGAERVLNFGVVRYFTDLACLLVQNLNTDAKKEKFEEYLISQIEATQPGTVEAFAKAFGLKTEQAWLELEDAVYDAIEGR